MGQGDNPHPLKRFFGRHRELLAVLTSGFVGALALGTSTYNVYLQRQQVKASVWPHVTMDIGMGEEGFSLVLRNRGVGPAQLERFRVTVDGKPTLDWVDMLEKLLHEDSLPYVPDTVTLEEEVMTPGMELTILKLPPEQDIRQIVAQSDRLRISVCYCSTLDDCWELGLRQGTKPVSACSEDRVPFTDMSWKTKKWIHERFWPAMDAADAAAEAGVDGGASAGSAPSAAPSSSAGGKSASEKSRGGEPGY